MEYNKNELLKDLDDTMENLVQTVSSFKEEDIDKIPFEGSWTAGQTSEHLLKSNVTKLLYGDTKKTGRKPDENIRQTKELMLDFGKKMTAPDFNTPTNEKHDKVQIINSFKKVHSEAREAAETLDLTETCTGFELPGSGMFTRLEWLYFMIYHYQRHTHQLKNIYDKLYKQF